MFSVRVLQVPFREALFPAAKLLKQALSECGLYHAAARPIVLGAHAALSQVPRGAVIYDTEHPGPRPAEFTRKLGEFEVWSYTSLSGIPGAKYVPLLPTDRSPWASYLPGRKQDIPLLFIGHLNERREKILAEFARQKLPVCHAMGVWGPQLEHLEARSQIVLNLHYYDQEPGPIFESSRVVPAAMRGAFVLTEPCHDMVLEMCVIPGPFGIVEAAKFWLDVGRSLEAVREQRYQQRVTMHSYVRAAAEGSSL